MTATRSPAPSRAAPAGTRQPGRPPGRVGRPPPRRRPDAASAGRRPPDPAGRPDPRRPGPATASAAGRVPGTAAASSPAAARPATRRHVDRRRPGTHGLRRHRPPGGRPRPQPSARPRRPTGSRPRGAAAEPPPPPGPRRCSSPAPTQPQPRPARRTPLRIVAPPDPDARARRRRRLVAGALVGLACAGLFAIVGVRVLLAQGQGPVDALESQVTAAQAENQRLRLDVARLESPARIVAEAQARLGMVPAGRRRLPPARQPVARQPVARQPVARQPVARQPIARQPIARQPGVAARAGRRPAVRRVNVPVPRRRLVALLVGHGRRLRRPGVAAGRRPGRLGRALRRLRRVPAPRVAGPARRPGLDPRPQRGRAGHLPPPPDGVGRPVPRAATRPPPPAPWPPSSASTRTSCATSSRADTEFVYLARKVDDAVAAAVERPRPRPASFLLDEPTRFLPVGHAGRARPRRGRRPTTIGPVRPRAAVRGGSSPARPGELLVEKDLGGNDIAAGIRQLEPPAAGRQPRAHHRPGHAVRDRAGAGRRRS